MSRFRNPFPGIPDPQPTLESLLEVSRMLKESVETLRGLRGLPEERALTQKDIEQGLEISWEQVSVGLPTSFPPSPHGHTIPEVSGLSAALAAKSNVGHTHPFTQITGVATMAQLPADAIRLAIQSQLEIDASQISNLPSPSSGAERFSELSDVAGDIVPSDGDVPIWDDYLELYVPSQPPGAGIVERFTDLLDVEGSIVPADGDVPIWDDYLSKYVPGPQAGGPGGGPQRVTRGATWIMSDGSAIVTPAIAIPLYCPVAAIIRGVSILTNGGTGSCVVDVRKVAFASYPPSSGDSIVASAAPTISSDLTYLDTTLTGWDTAVDAGDTLIFVLVSSSGFTLINITLDLEI